MELLLALETSQVRVLNLLDGINTELAKAALNNGTTMDYNALGSYSRKLSATVDEEIAAISKFREISDPINKSRKTYYMNYLTRLKPFAANLETGSALAQKKEYPRLQGFFRTPTMIFRWSEVRSYRVI